MQGRRDGSDATNHKRGRAPLPSWKGDKVGLFTMSQRTARLSHPGCCQSESLSSSVIPVASMDSGELVKKNAPGVLHRGRL
jgi:hypothetical protein